MSNEIHDESKNENNEKERLTIEELRECEGFEDYSNKEAKDMVDFIYDISVVLFNHAQTNPI